MLLSIAHACEQGERRNSLAAGNRFFAKAVCNATEETGFQIPLSGHAGAVGQSCRGE
jgi:hypothetical protein